MFANSSDKTMGFMEEEIIPKDRQFYSLYGQIVVTQSDMKIFVFFFSFYLNTLIKHLWVFS